MCQSELAFSEANRRSRLGRDLVSHLAGSLFGATSLRCETLACKITNTSPLITSKHAYLLLSLSLILPAAFNLYFLLYSYSRINALNHTPFMNHERIMRQPCPGSLVQYRASGSSLPSWPAVICTDDMAPKEVQRTRPRSHCYVTLILLLDEHLEL